MSPLERLMRRLPPKPSSGCWEWPGATTPFGYGAIGRGGRGTGNVLAHRLMWESVNGPIPDGMFVLHRCDNPPCVRVEHLFLGTRADNNRDMREKGRHPIAIDGGFLTRARWAKR